jgi:ornithine carbamoyltransferase
MVATQLLSPIGAAGLTSDLDLSTSELRALLNLAAEVKRAPRDFRRDLESKSAALLFEKPSLRTRFSNSVEAWLPLKAPSASASRCRM